MKAIQEILALILNMKTRRSEFVLRQDGRTFLVNVTEIPE
jgi:hypothetical protein